MHWISSAIHHPTGVSLVPILLVAFLVGFGVQRVLAAAGNRWWPVPAERAAATESGRASRRASRRHD